MFKFVGVIAILIGSISTTYASAPACSKAALGQSIRASIHNINNTNVLLIAGGIEADSGKKLAPYIFNKRAYQEVWLCSGGGAVKGGLAIGRALNRARATVKIPNNYFCASACTIAFMGGYARIIEPNARFVTHASSSAKSFGYKLVNGKTKYSYFASYDCDTSYISAYCSSLRTYLNKLGAYQKTACAKPSNLYQAGSQCIFFDTQGHQYRENMLLANSLLTVYLSHAPQLAQQAVHIDMRSSLTSEVDLLAYFQTMLLDGRRNLLNQNAYWQIKNNFVPTNIYNLTDSHLYARDFTSDLEAMKKAVANTDRTFAIWQTVLTDIELSLKAQISRYIKNNQLNLGPAGKEALKMYDAMRTCQIQSSCRLETHTANSLGYQNMYNYK